MRIGLVCPTIGRPRGIDDLLRSIHAQRRLPAHVVISDQSEGDEVRAVVERWAERVPVLHVRCPGQGISFARNVGLGSLEAVDVIGFPDDDCVYPEQLLERIDRAFVADDALAGVCGRLVSKGAGGTRMGSAATRQALDRSTVWKLAIEPAMFLRPRVLEQVGVFDETLGVGGPTRWQSGEGTELLIRALDAGLRIEHHPDLLVEEIDPRVFLTRDEYLGKTRRYARGTGRVYRMHYPWSARVRVVARPVGGALLAFAKRDLAGVRRYRQVALGRVEGLLSRD
jgi:glycosyltransferase involved in cell wall biosynthesis